MIFKLIIKDHEKQGKEGMKLPVLSVHLSQKEVHITVVHPLNECVFIGNCAKSTL